VKDGQSGSSSQCSETICDACDKLLACSQRTMPWLANHRRINSFLANSTSLKCAGRRRCRPSMSKPHFQLEALWPHLRARAASVACGGNLDAGWHRPGTWSGASARIRRRNGRPARPRRPCSKAAIIQPRRRPAQRATSATLHSA